MLIFSALATCLVYDRVFGLSSMSGGAGVHRGATSLTRRLGLWLLAGAATFFSSLSEALARLLGGHRFGWLLPAYAWSMIALLIVPIVAIIPMAFTTSTFLSFPPPHLGLRWFAEYFHSEVWVSATLRSFGIGLATAAVTLVIAVLAAFAVARSASRWSGAVFLVFMTPIIVPSIVIAVALFYVFAQMGLVATDTGIMIGHTVSAIPIAFVILLATLKNYDWRLDQAAATLGANRLRSFRRIAVPLIKSGLIAAFIFAFLASFEELTVALFIGGGLKSTLPKQMWDDVTLQVSPTLAAASVVVLLVVTALFMLAESIRPREDKPA
jgi:putative spermidine/putrescine transport system permease protein